MTVGELRRALDGVPDGAPVLVTLPLGCTRSSNDYALQVHGAFCITTHDGRQDIPTLELLGVHPDDAPPRAEYAMRPEFKELDA
jgi:hypothetical protein